MLRGLMNRNALVIGWPALISGIAAPATDCIAVCELASCAAGAFLSAHQPAHSSNPKTFPVLVSANSLPVLPVLTPFSLSRGDTLSPTGSHPVILHVYV